MQAQMAAKERAWSAMAANASAYPHVAHGAAQCVDGVAAGEFSCSGVDMLSLTPRTALHVGTADFCSDLWGWVHPTTGVEYALLGMLDGVAFLDISEPTRPQAVGWLPGAGSPAGGSWWRDVKTFRHYALIVSDDIENSGLQVLDLLTLPDKSSLDPTLPPPTLAPSAEYHGFSRAHNIIVSPGAAPSPPASPRVARACQGKALAPRLPAGKRVERRNAPPPIAARPCPLPLSALSDRLGRVEQANPLRSLLALRAQRASPAACR